MKLETICLHGGAAPEQQAAGGITPELDQALAAAAK
jgi:hypothetical protein